MAGHFLGARRALFTRTSQHNVAMVELVALMTVVVAASAASSSANAAARWWQVGLRRVLSAMCNASQCTTIRNHLEFSRSCTVASLHGSTDARFVPLVTCLRATGIERSETRIPENGKREEGLGWGCGRGREEMEMERRKRKVGRDGRKSFIECGGTAFGVARHNYLGKVAYTKYLASILGWTTGWYNSRWHRTEVGDLLQSRTCKPPLERRYRT